MSESLDLLLELTRTLCPTCLKVVDGQVVSRRGKVYMRRRCPEHGVSEGLISGDVAIHQKAQEFNKPGTRPLKFATEVQKGCPYDCGLCPEHKQHTCLAILEVTNACNMRCPTCFSSSGPGDFLELKTIRDMVDAFVSSEAAPEALMISGGEPSIHPRILEILELVRQKGVRYPILNTNGKRVARDTRFVRRLGELGVTLYLQFDGFRSSTYRALRGESDLFQIKKRALEHCRELKLGVILVMTVEAGVNEDEIGAVAAFGLHEPSVKGIVYQPVFHCGRHEAAFDPMNRITLADVVHRLVEQTGGLFRVSDLIPDPCPYPTCGSTTYVYIDGGRVEVLPRLVDVSEYLNYLQNRTLPDERAVKEALESRL
ncbi:MAG: radical SAM protein [Planctomycetota bacterium]